MSVSENSISQRKFYPFLDYMRILSAFFVFLFHSNIHLGIHYGVLNPFVNTGAIFMTVFFMLSGIVLALNYGDKDLTCLSEYILFIKKRIISIYPAYIVLYVLIVVKFILTKTMNLSVVQNFVVLPVELTLFQSVFGNSFETLHNGGTWFISCIFICYLLFPFLCKIIMQMTKKQIVCLSVFLYCILTWAPIVEYFMDYSSIYANPFFRTLEFLLGICLVRVCKLFVPPKLKFSVIICIVIHFVLFLVVTVIKYYLKIGSFCLYNFIVEPASFFVFYFGIHLSNTKINNFFNGKTMKYFSNISYVFFLAQFFTWDSYRLIKKIFNIKFNNLESFLLSFLICMIISIVMYELMVKPLTKIMKNKML